MAYYSGNKLPFIFISFDEKDKNEVMKIVERLSTSHKIYASSALGSSEQKIMKKAALSVLILSSRSMPDMEEKVTATANLKKSIIPVYLDKFELNPGMRMLLGTYQGVSRHKYNEEEEFYESLSDSPALSSLSVTEEQKKSAKKNFVGILAVSVVVAALATVLVFGVIKPFSGTKISEDSVLGRLGLSGNADSIKTVYVYGAELRDQREIYGAQLINYAGEYLKQRVSLPGCKTSVSVGDITDCSDFAVLKNVEELAIAGNKINDFSPLWSLKKLKVLDISSNLSNGEEGFSIDGISGLTELEELNLGYCNVVSGLEELKNMPSLKILYIDSDINGDRIASLGDVSFEVIWLDARITNWEEMKAASEADNIFFYYFGNPHGEGESEQTIIDIPEGETLFVREFTRTGGVNGVINNYGTIIIEGEWEFGLTEINNYGTIIVRGNGFYICGMSTTNNYGIFTIEEGAAQSIERGHEVYLYDGVYTNNGHLYIGFGGTLIANGGRAVNNGTFEYASNPEWPYNNEKDLRYHEELIEGNGTVKAIPEELPDFLNEME